MNSGNPRIQTANRYSIFLCDDDESNGGQKALGKSKKNKKKSKKGHKSKSEVIIEVVDSRPSDDRRTITSVVADRNENGKNGNGLVNGDVIVDREPQTEDEFDEIADEPKTLDATMSWYDMCEEEEDETVVQVEGAVETSDFERSCNVEHVIQYADVEFIPSHEQPGHFVCSNHDRDRPVEDQAVDKCDNDDLPGNDSEWQQKPHRQRSKVGSQARHFRNTERNVTQMQQPASALNGTRHHHHHHHQPQSVNNGNNSAKAPIKHHSRDSHVPIHQQQHQQHQQKQQMARHNRNGGRFAAADGNGRLGGGGGSWRAKERTHETNIADIPTRLSAATTMIDNNWRSNKKFGERLVKARGAEGRC